MRYYTFVYHERKTISLLFKLIYTIIIIGVIIIMMHILLKGTLHNILQRNVHKRYNNKTTYPKIINIYKK